MTWYNNDIIKTVDTSKNFIKHFKTVFGKEITLTKNKIKDIMKVIRALKK